ncbi:PH domain-containing protein [Propionimicrobium sp. PCR01-08-3]|uniref:PH domain-containing protein n=1 Tax=Propionimicrobium sp. PCR01-08-3 TaxID=3052086 RepID=UPI00255CC697|nr:PH domain-containing protein [Propionimicrobium sp. PCR01-08-3]WIY82811.1 PH domain-containing protein [Propionimicrobium sp. PCR01-08-3]
MNQQQSALFAPPTEAWTPVSRRYAGLRRLSSATSWVFLALIIVGPQAFMVFFLQGFPGSAIRTLRWTLAASAAVLLVLAIWRLWRQGAIARSWAYAERDSDLYIKSGIFNRRLTVIPYGRMQAVNISAGPIERAFKVATVKLVTASAQSDAVIPGLDPEAAAALRDRLTERGEIQATGL